jgi:hypothetical protein
MKTGDYGLGVPRVCSAHNVHESVLVRGTEMNQTVVVEKHNSNMGEPGTCRTFRDMRKTRINY